MNVKERKMQRWATPLMAILQCHKERKKNTSKRDVEFLAYSAKGVYLHYRVSSFDYSHVGPSQFQTVREKPRNLCPWKREEKITGSFSLSFLGILCLCRTQRPKIEVSCVWLDHLDRHCCWCKKKGNTCSNFFLHLQRWEPVIIEVLTLSPSPHFDCSFSPPPPFAALSVNESNLYSAFYIKCKTLGHSCGASAVKLHSE